MWRLKYRLGGDKERLYSVGAFPGIGLEAARVEREAVKAYLREGRDPVKARQLGRAAASTASDTTFGGAAEDWLARRRRDWSKIHYETSRRALDRVTLAMAGKHSLHGWRSSFATLARDAGFAREVVELTLDHIHDNSVARAYDRGARLTERRQLMDWWDATLTGVPYGADVIPFRKTGVA